MLQNNNAITGSFPIILNPEGLIIECGEGISDLLNIRESQMKGIRLDQLLESLNAGWKKAFNHNLQLSETNFSLTQADGSGHVGYQLHFQLLHKQNLTFVTLSRIDTANKLFDGSIRDIFDDPNKVSQLFLRLQRAESRLESYMQHFPGVFFYQRTDYSFQYISPNFTRILAYPPDRLLKSGSQFLGMIYDQDRDFFVKELRKHSSDKAAFTMQFRMRKPKDNSVIYLTDVRSPIHSDSGILLGYEGVWLDTTRQTIAERKLTSSAWKENLAMLTAGLVHDFSNVMAGIFALSELYHSSIEPGDKMYEGLGQIKKSSMEARQLVRRIIDINREEASQKNYHDPKKLIYEQLDLLKIIFPRGTHIDLDLCGEEIPVYIDDVEFRQLLLNLAMNSKDALGKQGEIMIKTSRIKENQTIFENTHKGKRVTNKPGIIISFTDNGSGIPEIHRDSVFNSFFTTKEIHKGSGFGLYNIERIILAVDGMIDFETKDNIGTTFHIYIPEADFTEQLAEIKNSEDEDRRSIKQRPHVVVYSSEDASQFDLISMLRSKSWEVIVFRDIKKMESYLQDSRRNPDFCLLIDVEYQSDISGVCKMFRKNYPDTLLALLPMGRTAEEIPSTVTKDIAMVCDSSISPNKLIQNLEKLITSPISKR